MKDPTQKAALWSIEHKEMRSVGAHDRQVAEAVMALYGGKKPVDIHTQARKFADALRAAK